VGSDRAMGRIHLDTVERLGEFLELEVVLRAGQTIAMGEDMSRGLTEWLGIEGEDLLEDACIDMIERLGAA
jgi:adenylate cyclase class IV